MSDIIDINVTPVVEQVEINVTENLTTVNINTVQFDDSNVVHKTGNETIEDVKSFKKSIKIDSNEPLDAKYLNGTVAYASLEEANTLIPIGIRSPYLTIVVQGVEYWWADGAWGIKKDTYISVTKAELDTLITNNGLETGFPYKITGVHPDLYGGTTIYSKAIDRNKIEINAIGTFYTPKYDAVSGSGIWTGYVECGVTGIVGLFDVGELVTANNGATGQLFGNVNGGFITPLTGTWSTVTSITGNDSGATAVISSVSVPLTYAIGDKTIWGGYHWSNLTGNLGSKVDDFNLDATNWAKVAYNETDYNVYYDEISYDLANDFISYRKDNLGNEISFTYSDYLWFIDYYGEELNSIKYFQFGNKTDIYNGVWNNTLNGGFANIINFRGSYINSNTFGQGSYINSNTFAQYSGINSNTFGQSSYIDSNTFAQYSGIYSNTFGQGSYINSNTFAQYSGINSNTFGQSSGIDSNTIPANKAILNTFFENGCGIGTVTLTSAVEIFEIYSKTIYKRPDGVIKIKYYNNNNVLVIADITD